ncbi:MAG: hypothetical protein KJT03_20695, partial [Verrucomicrobiae bacterium]|nr:hypothetical protein [Verrucomicrobiae bacterium]
PVAKYPGNPVVRADRPWERGLAVPQGSVIYDEEDRIYKMWYTTNVQSRGDGTTFNKGKALAYATSDDGIDWEKPLMDLVLEDGLKTNQVIGTMEFGYMYQPYFVIKDLKESDPGRRYKMAFLSIQRNVTDRENSTHPGTRRGLGIGFSPDGLHWTKVRDFASDDIIDISHFMIDPHHDDQFVIYGRTLQISPEIREAWQHYDWFKKAYNGRSVIRSTSKDFLKWEPAEFIMGADLKDPPSTMIYSMNVFPYEGIYLGLAQRYISRLDVATIDIQLAISRDGVHFERPFRDAFFPLGGVGTWDRFILHNMSGPPLEDGEKLRFYYGGRTSRHQPNNLTDEKPGGGTGLATILRDRFVAVEASFDGGTLMTKPVKLDGSKLFVNCNAAFGKLEVTLLDTSGNPIPGFTTSVEGVDAVEQEIRFDKSLRELGPNPVKLSFSLYNSQLFSFCVKE